MTHIVNAQEMQRMTDLETMPPRELDALVAEKVMGYTWRECEGFDILDWIEL